MYNQLLEYYESIGEKIRVLLEEDAVVYGSSHMPFYSSYWQRNQVSFH